MVLGIDSGSITNIITNSVSADNFWIAVVLPALFFMWIFYRSVGDPF